MQEKPRALSTPTLSRREFLQASALAAAGAVLTACGERNLFAIPPATAESTAIPTATAEPTAIPTATAESTAIPTPTAEPTAIPTPTAEPIDRAVAEYVKYKQAGATEEEKAEIKQSLEAIIASYPRLLESKFIANEGEALQPRDLGTVNIPDNGSPDRPESPKAIYAVDEGGATMMATGYAFATINSSVYKDGKDAFRLAAPWGGVDNKANHTYHLYFYNHLDDGGAAQVGLDHYPAGSVSVTSLSPDNNEKYDRTPKLFNSVDMALNIYESVQHSSGHTDEIQPPATVDLAFVDVDSGSVQVFTAEVPEADFSKISWIESQGQLPTVSE